MDFATFLIQCLNALQYGLLLFLVASGLTLIFGIMGVINLAHGSFYMIGAYMAYALAPIVERTFGGLKDGALVDAVLDWIADHLEYRAGVSTVMTTAVDTLIDRAKRSLDECYAGLKADGLLVAKAE